MVINMKPKTPRVVVTFHTTAEAMATEKLCNKNHLDGRLISAPRALSADCGIAWSAPAALRETLEKLLTVSAVEYNGIHELLL